jgi:hypothetical protein
MFQLWTRSECNIAIDSIGHRVKSRYTCIAPDAGFWHLVRMNAPLRSLLNLLHEPRPRSHQNANGEVVANAHRIIVSQITFFLAAVTPGYLLLLVKSSSLIWRVEFAVAVIWFLLILGVMLAAIVRHVRSGFPIR